VDFVESSPGFPYDRLTYLVGEVPLLYWSSLATKVPYLGNDKCICNRIGDMGMHPKIEARVIRPFANGWHDLKKSSESTGNFQMVKKVASFN